MFRKLRLDLAAIAATALIALAPAVSQAQDVWPSRNVTIVVPFAPGGATDVLSRLIGKELEEKFKRAFVVENRPGAGGIVGAQAVLRAPHDGYTIFLGSGTNLAVNVSLYKKLPYDPAKEFIPLGLAAATPFVLVVNPKLPINSVKEFIDYVKARPGQLSYATSGPGVPHHLFIELLSSMAGLKMAMVPYKGSLPALNDVVAGHVPLMMVDLGPASGSLKAKSVRPLGVSTAERVEGFKDIPPIADTLPGFDASGWFMMAGPAGMPDAIAEKLNAALSEIFEKPHIRQEIVKFGLIPRKNRSIPELKKFIVAEIEKWRQVVRQAGVEGKF